MSNSSKDVRLPTSGDISRISLSAKINLLSLCIRNKA